jgi:hypothetical protein
MFQSGERLILFQMGPFIIGEETQVSLRRNPFMVEAAASTILFSCENWVRFGKNTSCKSEIPTWTKVHFVSQRPIHLRWRKACMSKREQAGSKAQARRTLFTSDTWITFWMECSCKSELSGWMKIILFWIGLFAWVEKTHVPLKRKPAVLEAGASSTLFYCENSVSFWKEDCCKSAFSRCRKLHFVPHRTV